MKELMRTKIKQQKLRSRDYRHCLNTSKSVFGETETVAFKDICCILCKYWNDSRAVLTESVQSMSLLQNFIKVNSKYLIRLVLVEFSEKISLGLKFMLKFQILLLKSIFPFSKKTWKHTLHRLYTVLAFTVEFGFTKW